MNLCEETRTLAKKFRGEADRIDTIFTQTCDSRALQGGAICEEADSYRKVSRELFKIVRMMESGDF